MRDDNLTPTTPPGLVYHTTASPDQQHFSSHSVTTGKRHTSCPKVQAPASSSSSSSSRHRALIGVHCNDLQPIMN
ncbi:hypothetical protein E2C01_020771 [Portunus trituberculatus]|uniref:Uncharacterized protein n=1 Tax=Portunus trituberculatus TaxID=210409 RepID=A0A5B7E1H0_PORTR|nr:hypothetical protein [Portunus trituberculatus]